MSRTKRFFKNSFSTAFYQIVVMFVGFIIPYVLINNYGSEVNGLISSINQFVAYFRLVEAGLSGAAVYALFKPLANKDIKAINSIVSASKIFYIKTGYIFVSLIIGLSIVYPFFVDNEISSLNISLLILVLGINGTMDFFTLAKYRVLLTADQRTYVISIASLVYSIVNCIIIVILGTLKANIILLFSVALLSIFIRTFILMYYVKTNYKYINYNETPNFTSLNKRWDALYLQILGTIQTGAPIVLLTLITKDLKLVSVYTIYNMIIIGLNGILRIFNSGLASSFGDIIARGEIKKLQRVYNEFEFLYYSILTIVYAVAFLTIMPFINIYTNGVNDVDYNIPIIGFLFVLNGLLYNIKNPQGMLVISAGMYKETKVQTTIQGAIVILLGLILTPSMGIIGVLLASIASNIYRDIDLIIFISRNLTKLPIKITIFRLIRMLVVILIIYSSSMYTNKLYIKSYIEWGLLSINVGILALLTVLFSSIIFEKSNVNNTIKRFMTVFKKHSKDKVSQRKNY